jgi:predicted Fe-S protein YdhL (DUF1289 family)|tara:strand:+ start:974 stop:1198 length:225 start_codon:yes stop_codon:yes gene_type:complete
MSNKVLSPCIDRCFTNGTNCTSCGRTNDEVQEWFDASEEQRKIILEKCVKRLDSEAYGHWEEMYEYKKEEQEGS